MIKYFPACINLSVNRTDDELKSQQRIVVIDQKVLIKRNPQVLPSRVSRTRMDTNLTTKRTLKWSVLQERNLYPWLCGLLPDQMKHNFSLGYSILMLLSSFLQSNFPPCRRILHFPALTSETRRDGRRRETGAGAEWPGPVSRAGTRGRPGPGHQSGRADQRENIVTRRRKYRGEKYQDVRQQWCGDHRQIVSDEWWHYCHETLNFAESTELIVIDWKFTYSPKTFLNMNIPICITLLASFQLATSKIEAETVSRKDGINPGIITKASFMYVASGLSVFSCPRPNVFLITIHIPINHLIYLLRHEPSW